MPQTLNTLQSLTQGTNSALSLVTFTSLWCFPARAGELRVGKSIKRVKKGMQEYGGEAYHSAAAQRSRAHVQAGSPGPAQRPSRETNPVIPAAPRAERSCSRERHWEKAAVETVTNKFTAPLGRAFLSPPKAQLNSLCPVPSRTEAVPAQPPACGVVGKGIHK